MVWFFRKTIKSLKENISPKGKTWALKMNYLISKNDKIEFFKFHCLGWNYGKGQYKIIADSLIITFDDSVKLGLPYSLSFIESEYANNFNINLNTIDGETGQPMPGVSISIQNSNNGTATDKYGKATLKIDKSHIPCTLITMSVGCKSIEIPLELKTQSAGDIDLTIIMQVGEKNFYQQNERIAYKITAMDKKSFVIQINENLKVKYQKIRPNKFKELTKEIKNFLQSQKNH